jgi:hypothetical protein
MSPQNEPDKLNRVDTNGADGLPDGSIQPFEAQLASLAPRAVHLDRDRLMFLAGRASSGRAPGGWAWPAAFSAVSALAAGLLLTLLLRSQPREVTKIVYVPRPASAPEATPAVVDRQIELEPAVAAVDPAGAEERDPAGAEERGGLPAKPREGSYVRLRDHVLAMGIESWTNDRSAVGERKDSSPQTYQELLDSLLHDG